MKIKILKDIPGYKKDEVLDCSKYRPSKYDYKVSYLVEDGYAEEIKEIDIEEIRKTKRVSQGTITTANPYTVATQLLISEEEKEWFSAYRVISEVIRQLNGDWVFKAERSNDNGYEIWLSFRDDVCDQNFIADAFDNRRTLIPRIKDEEIAQKVIDLCTPELLTLFNVK